MIKLKPDAFFQSVRDITVAHLKAKGMRGVILDIDDTLSGHNIEEFGEDIREWLSSLKKAGIRVCLLSNNRRKRAERAAGSLGLMAIGRAKKPLKGGFRAAAQRMELPLDKVCVIGDQIFTDILGGNRLGLYTILVDPITRHSSLFFRFKRLMERPVMNHLRRERER